MTTSLFSELSYEELKAAKLEIESLMQRRRDDALEAFRKTAAAMDITDETPKRHRRTKAQIEADNASHDRMPIAEIQALGNGKAEL